MRKIIKLLMLAASLCVILRAEIPSVTFSGIRYELASVDVAKDGTVTNEYVPIGESINSWTRLLAVRYWPKITKVEKATEFWIGKVRPLLARDAVSFVADGNPNDVIIEAWLAAPDKSYIEANLQHFVIEKGIVGVKAYQYAEIIPATGPKADPKPFMQQRDSRCLELSKLKLGLFKSLK